MWNNMTISITSALALMILAVLGGAIISYLFSKKYKLLKRSELNAIQEENVWYKRTLDSSGIGVYRWESSNNQWYWSDRLYQLREFEINDQNAVLKLFYDRVHPDDRDRLRRSENRCRNNGTPLSCDYRFILPDGEIRWHRELANLISNGAHKVMYGVVIDVTEQKIKEEQLEHFARRDKLTGLPNRAGFDRYLNDTIKKSNPDEDIILLGFIDLNGFKSVNDKYGHPAGDHVLRIVGSCLESRTTQNDFVARLGGDEFVFLSKHPKENYEQAIKEIENTLAQAFNDVALEAKHLAVGAAIGISSYPQDATIAKELLSNADSAMYSAKRTKEWFKIFLHKDRGNNEN